MTRDELIERMARAAIIDSPHASVCLSVLCGRISGLSEVIDGRAVIVPREATEKITSAIVDAAQIYNEYGVNMYVSNPEDVYTAMIEASPFVEKKDA